MSEDSIDRLLHKVPPTRRQVIKRLLVGTFVVPVVSSFPLDGRAQLYLSSAGASNATDLRYRYETFQSVSNSTTSN